MARRKPVRRVPFARRPAFDLNAALGVGQRAVGPREIRTTGATTILGSSGIAYEAARRDRLTAGWRTSSGSADVDLLPNLKTLRERSRELSRNNSLAKAIVRVIVTCVVGTGLRLLPRVDAEATGLSAEAATAWNRKTAKLFSDWSKEADLHGRLDFAGIQALMVERWIVDGESLAMPVYLRRPWRRWATAIEVVETDRLTDPSDSVIDRRHLREGVELDPQTRAPVAYHVAAEHPGDYYAPGSTKTARIPAWTSDGTRRIYHLFLPRRPGQSRGEPMFAPVMLDFHHLGEYDEAELVAARISACHTIWRKKELDDYNLADQAGTTAGGEPVEEIEPGMVTELGPGEDVTFGNPTRPSSNFEPYFLAKLRFICAAFGLPLELVLADFTKTTYTSGRMSVIEANRDIRFLLVAVVRFCQAMYEIWLAEAVEEGLVEAPGFEADPAAWARAGWIANARHWVDPKKEVEAAILKIEKGFSTLADECAALGTDWEEMAEQRALEIKKLRELGLQGPDTAKIGEAVRAGMLTPQMADEVELRRTTGLPAPGEEVRRSWTEEGGARRPITLTQPRDPDAAAQTEDAVAATEPEPDDEPDDDPDGAKPAGEDAAKPRQPAFGRLT